MYFSIYLVFIKICITLQVYFGQEQGTLALYIAQEREKGR